MGFAAADTNHRMAGLERNAIMKEIEPEDLLTYGFIPEFIGRLPMTTVLDELTEDQLVSILTEPKNALTRQYSKLMSMEGVRLEFEPDALKELARQAIKKGTGARALRGLLERIMRDVMFDIPDQDDVLAVTITRPVVLEETKPVVTRRGEQARAA
jgi:ATP-dependent Clp protease ATP-binding subunit ClpX